MSDAAQPPIDTEVPDPWRVRHLDPTIGGPEFGRLVEAMRLLQDRFVGAAPPPEHTWALAARLEELAEEFAAWQAADEYQAPAGMRNDLPGRGNALLVPFVIDEQTETLFRGHVTFRRFHLGGNGAAHGGTIPLLFDDVFGRLVNGPDRPVSRTAYLTVGQVPPNHPDRP